MSQVIPTEIQRILQKSIAVLCKWLYRYPWNNEALSTVCLCPVSGEHLPSVLQTLREVYPRTAELIHAKKHDARWCMKDHKHNHSRGRSPMGGTPLWSEDRKWPYRSPAHRTPPPAVIALVIFHTSTTHTAINSDPHKMPVVQRMMEVISNNVYLL